MSETTRTGPEARTDTEASRGDKSREPVESRISLGENLLVTDYNQIVSLVDSTNIERSGTRFTKISVQYLEKAIQLTRLLGAVHLVVEVGNDVPVLLHTVSESQSLSIAVAPHRVRVDGEIRPAADLVTGYDQTDDAEGDDD